MPEWPFHLGELEAQARAGGGSRGGAIRSAMPEQHRTFFEALPFVVVATIDHAGRGVSSDRGAAGELRAAGDHGAPGHRGAAGDRGAGGDRDDGWPVAAIWAGAPGFVRAPDAQTLRIAVAPDPSDPAARAFVPGAPFGLLGIELATKRRNRANGVIARQDQDGIVVAIEQSFGNCPQYIHPRELHRAEPGSGSTERFDGMDRAAATAIARADTFFVATAARTDEPTGGVDVSHRGGPPGFVRIDGNTLTIPDYKGNRYFNTLGNLVSQPRAALLFVDFASGRMLQLQGTAEVLWHDHSLPHAERSWRFKVERGWRAASGLRQVAVQAPSTESAAPVAAEPMSETR
jgi:predicted pyridoxine 5'-phosphate oxidase superfamily flavin-nucleotide-binding protein